ncbi:MAG: ADP-ribose diphosphatase [Candidatus Pelagadaptatus aseana]|uniref:NUDIX domain-containing protein n=1 Tax=Candidatus Pelagadaptatus aseana TaxID=3120508 RepID=UPI0039B1DBFC
MPLPKEPYSTDDVEILDSEPLFRSFFKADKVTLRHRLYQGGWSAPITREIFIRGEAVGVLLYDPVNDLIGLVEQFRIGALQDAHGPWCMEVVAGMVEANESLEEVAWREVEEETDLKPDALEYICEYMASPGGCDERLHVYCARLNLQGAGGVHGLVAEGEDIKLHVMAAAEVFAELYSGRFNNAATMIALQWLQLNRPRLQQQAGGA